MTPEQRKLARHALGLDNPDAKKRSYRNRFFAGRGHPAWNDLHDMVGAGWMNLKDTKIGVETVFWMTLAGARLALDPGERLDPEDFPVVEWGSPPALTAIQSIGDETDG